jgi:S-adenosylmethionine synthetase
MEMSVRNGLFTSEAVSSGHPDKLCDRISDAILDEFIRRDPNARVACETLAANDKIIVAGEFRTARREHFEEVQRQAPAIVRQVLTDIGYGTADHDIDPDTCKIEIRFNHQSAEIAKGVDGSAVLGAGDQGLMFGYATTETKALMPLAWSLATDLVAAGTALRESGGSGLRPDAKSQVTVRYKNGEPVGIQAVVLSWQHDPKLPLASVRELLLHDVMDPVIPESQRTADFRTYINPAGAWTLGGPKGDTGLTGRKIIVDTYGGACAHGGGAFSGKDPSKVDRSGAYAARWVAKTVVAAGLATRCTVQVAYAIGVAEPVSIHVDVHGTGIVSEAAIERVVRQVFDLTPGGIIRDLDLLRPIYTATSSLGHFGRWRDPQQYRWESTERAGELFEVACRHGNKGARAVPAYVPAPSDLGA